MKLERRGERHWVIAREREDERHLVVARRMREGEKERAVMQTLFIDGWFPIDVGAIILRTEQRGEAIY